MSAPEKIDTSSTAGRPKPPDVQPNGSYLVGCQELFRSASERAYEKFEARGFRHGHDLDDWLMSEREKNAERRDHGEAESSDSRSSASRT